MRVPLILGVGQDAVQADSNVRFDSLAQQSSQQTSHNRATLILGSIAVKWPRGAGPFLAAAKLEVRLLVVSLSSRQGFCLLLILIRLWACGQRVCVIHMSIEPGRRARGPDGHRRAIAERLMKAALVAEGEVFVDAGFRFAAFGKPLRYTSSRLSERQTRSMKTLSIQRQRPSIETRKPASISTPVEAADVNCERWTPFCLSSGDSGGVDFSATLHDEREDLSSKVTLQNSDGVEFGMPFCYRTSNIVLRSLVGP
jgi:hypothetical protein